MKINIHKCQKTCVVSLISVLSTLAAIGQGDYAYIVQDETNLYSFNAYPEIQKKGSVHFLPSTIDSVHSYGDDSTVFYPAHTVRLNNEFAREAHYWTNSWLGKKVVSTDNGRVWTFFYDGIKYNHFRKSYELQKDQSLVLKNLDIGDSWYIDPENRFSAYISKRVTMQTDLYTDELIYIEVTNESDDANLKWATGTIIVSKNLGVVRFPNLQYFPYEWRDCELAGFQKAKKGVYKPSWSEMLYMDVGDEYHTVYFQFDTLRYAKTLCLSIESQDAEHQVRKVKRLTYTKVSSAPWVLDSTEFIQDIRIKKFPLDLYPDDTIQLPDFEFDMTYLAVLDERGYNNNYKVGVALGNYTFETPLDGEYGDFTLKHGFDYFYDYTSFFKYYYLPLYTKHGDEEWGDPVDFSKVSVRQTDLTRVLNAEIYPNPAMGYFEVKTDKAAELQQLFFVGMDGYRQDIKILNRSSQSIYCEVNGISGTGILMGRTDTGQSVFIGRLVSLPQK